MSARPASVIEAWLLYQNREYPAALKEYRGVLAENDRSLDALYGMVNSLTMLREYGDAEEYCDRLEMLRAPAHIVRQKREWIRQARSANHRFGLAFDAGPLVYSHQFIGDPSSRYAYDKGRFGEGEAWYLMSARHAFSVSASHFNATFMPDSVWKEIVFLDTLYASLGQLPATPNYLQGDFTNQFGEADTWYSDYTVPVRSPAPAYQTQVRIGWTGSYAPGSVSAGLTLGRSNLPGQKGMQSLWIGQTYSLPWFDVGLGENLQSLDKAMIAQLTPQITRAVGKAVLKLEPTWIFRIARDSLVPIPVRQYSLAAKLGHEGRVWSWSLGAASGRRAFISSEEGRVISSITLNHLRSYGVGAGWRPWGSRHFKFYTLFKREEYSQMDRHMAIAGTAYQW